MGTAPSLDGRIFVGVANDPGGDVGAETRFEYHEESDGVVWARYEGGTVRLGHLVGRRDGDDLDFRYSHLTTDGTTANGHCRSRIVVSDGGPIELHEEWEWESQPGKGTSLVREVVAPAGRRAKELLSAAPPDPAWADELADLRRLLEVDDRA